MRFKEYLVLFALAALWGASFLFITRRRKTPSF